MYWGSGPILGGHRKPLKKACSEVALDPEVTAGDLLQTQAVIAEAGIAAYEVRTSGPSPKSRKWLN